ncbi:beta-lactamase family protein [Flavisolibacter sp. BT320]|nr:beta-lactamase family protein [Flavisolibacter longurius]
MKPAKQLFLPAMLALLFVTCKKEGGSEIPPPPSPPPPPATQQDMAVVDGKIAAFLTTYNIPGASLAVTKNGKLVYRKGFGVADQATAEKVTPDHRFRLASVSKTYTGAAVMKLVQDGKLSLDAKVFGNGTVLGTTYGTAPYNANLSAITVRHLLQNVSGSWGGTTGGDVIDQNPTLSNTQMLNWVLNTRPNPATPGSKYDYSNVGFWIAGRVIEKVSGKSYIDYIKDDLLKPIGATQTDIAGKTAAERKTNEVNYYGQGSDNNFVYNIAFPRRDADGGLITTATDLARFITAIDGFATRPDILNAASLAELAKGSAVFPSYALGVGIWGAENLWYNYGSLPGTRTGFMRHNNGTNAVLLLNSRVAPASETAFVQGMQSLLLDLVKNTTYAWQDIDQF